MRRESDGPNIEFMVAKGFAVYATSEASDNEHRPHAIKLMLPLEQALSVHVGGVTRRIAGGRGLVLAADLRQWSCSFGRRVAVFLDPETTGRALGMWLRARGASVVELDEPRTSAVRGSLSCLGQAAEASRRDFVESVYAGLGVGSGCPPLDPRIARALEIIQSRALAPSAEELGASVCLSPGRLAHLFRDEIGLSIGRYSRWVRLVRAVEMVACGYSATSAAMINGFADLPHLSRTSRALLGQRLSALARGRGSVHGSAYPELVAQAGA